MDDINDAAPFGYPNTAFFQHLVPPWIILRFMDAVHLLSDIVVVFFLYHQSACLVLNPLTVNTYAVKAGSVKLYRLLKCVSQCAFSGICDVLLFPLRPLLF